MKLMKSTIVISSLIFAACGEAAIEPLDSTENSQIQANGMQLNGMQLNGMQINGMQLNGTLLNGMQLNGMQLNGMQLNGMQLNGSTLSATRVGLGQPLSGVGLVGTTLNITLGSGASATQAVLKFNAIYSDPLSPTGDVYLYDTSYQVVGTSTWSSLCTDAANNPVPMIPLANYWDNNTGARIDYPGAVTFACTSGAIGKCVRWGYRPWASETRCFFGICAPVALADYHQSCTRMVRADYCGDGTSNTVTGTPIDVYDGLTPQIQSPATTWPVEAKWTPYGATCLGNTRGAALYPGFKTPHCRLFPTCAANDYSVTGFNLLGNNYNGQAL